MIPYKQRVLFEDRLIESMRITNKFPGRIPVIVERSRSCHSKIPILDKEKFLVPQDLSIAQFIYIIRKRLTLPSEMAMFLFVGNTLPTTSTLLRELYAIHKDNDGFLYAQYSGENTLGSCYNVLWEPKNEDRIFMDSFDSWDEAITYAEIMANKHGDMICVLRFSSKEMCDKLGSANIYVTSDKEHKIIITTW